MYLVIYTKVASDDLENLDPGISKRIVRKVEYYTNQTKLLEFAKPLTGTLAGLYRYRIGDYRVVFEIDNNGAVTILSILSIKHRKDIYRWTENNPKQALFIKIRENSQNTLLFYLQYRIVLKL